MTEEVAGRRLFETWLAEPEPQEPWLIQRRARVQVGPALDEQAPPRWLPLRRRWRGTPAPEAPLPPDLKAAFNGQGWRSIPMLLSRIQGHRLVLDQKIAGWLDDGWVEVEEVASGVPETWTIRRVRLSAAAAGLLYLQPEQERHVQRQAEMAALSAKMAGWPDDAARARAAWRDDARMLALVELLAGIAAAQEGALREARWEPIPGLPQAQRPGDAPHRRWIGALRGILAHLSSEQWQYERTLSAVWLDDSKALHQERHAIAEYLGLPDLSEIGVFPHTPVVLCWGCFTASFEGHTLDGRAGMPFVALSAETIRAAQDWTIEADAIVAIENQTAFETALRPPLRDDRALCLFSGGHAGLAERELLKAWLSAAPDLPWHVWTDWDAGGVRIQMDWARWAREHGLRAPRPWLWEPERLQGWAQHGKPLSDGQRQLLQSLGHPLAQELLDLGVWMEQEAVLREMGAMGQTLLSIATASGDAT
jgi:hypothetical protein